MGRGIIFDDQWPCLLTGLGFVLGEVGKESRSGPVLEKPCLGEGSLFLFLLMRPPSESI